jgi:hypothetical protein
MLYDAECIKFRATGLPHDNSICARRSASRARDNLYCGEDQLLISD